MQRRTAKQLTNYAQAYDYALVRLSYRDYSEKDLERLLRQHACPQEVMSEVLGKLKEYSLLDDAKYADKVYSAWLSKKYYGINHLRLELKKKNISDELASKITSSFSEDMELERAVNTARSLQKKNNKKYGLDKADLLARTARALMTRGFNGNIIRKALNRLDSDFAE